MNKKLLKYIVLIVVAGLLVYNSVYIKKSTGTNGAAANTTLDPAQFAQQFWATTFTDYMDSAVEINSFMQLLKEDPDKAFKAFSKTQGIGNASYFLVQGKGVITTINENEVVVAAKSGSGTITIKLNTGIYFGNAIRDVTGKISMGDFANTMEYNNVSTELNKIVQTQIVMPFKTKAVKGAAVYFVGCVEIGQDQMTPDHTEILPVKINIII